MSENQVDSELRRFMYERVPSYEQLELLMLLAESSAPVTPASAAESLRTSASAVQEALDSLVRASLASRVPPDVYSFAPEGPELRELALRLVSVYRADRFAVVQVMTENSMRRLRVAAVDTFAECFRLGGPKKDG